MRTSPRILAGICCGLALTVGAAERTTTYTYTAEGLISSIDGPRADVTDLTTFTYDTAGNRATMTNALGHTTQYTDYDGAGRLLRMVGPNGLVTSFTYHPRGWLLSQATGEGAGVVVTSFAYDPAGNLTRVTLPDGGFLDLAYDLANRLTEVSDAAGNRIRYTLDAMGNRVAEQVEDSLGTVTRSLSRVYNDLNRLVQEIGADPSRTMDYAYDANGNLTGTTDALSRSASSSYDGLDRLIGQLDPAQGATALAYDPRDNLVGVTDPRENATTYTYNAFDEKITQASPDTGATAYTYDDVGNVLSIMDARGVTVYYAYDALNRLTNVSYPDPSLDVAFTYDEGVNGIGRLTGMQDAKGATSYGYDLRGNLISETRVADTGVETTTLYRYDANDRLDGMTYPSGREVTYSYDLTGNVSQVSSLFDGQTDVMADNVQHLPFGPTSSWVSGNGLQTDRQYDQDYQMVRLTVGSLMDLSYTYDHVGNIGLIVDGTDELRNQDLNYDPLDRLTDADGGYGILSFQYDAVGNRLLSSQDGVTTDLAYEPTSNRLAINLTSGEQYEHDATGNRTALKQSDGSGWRYSHGDDNRLRQVSRTVWQTTGKGKNKTTELVEEVVATFAYNGAGERVRKTSSAGTTYFRYGQAGQLLAEVDEAGAVTREYVYLNGQPLAIATYQAGDGGGGTKIIVDNDSAQTSSTGTWSLTSDRKGKDYGGDYRVADGGTGSTYRWVPTATAGTYDVQAWWVANRKNTSQAPFAIHHSGSTDTDTVTADQTRSGGQWVSLGTFAFDGSGGEYIEVSDANGKTVADAIRLVGQASSGGQIQSTGVQYVHTDHLGTPQVLTDEAGAVLWRADYQPFGLAAISGDESLQMLRFPGQYYDEETGLHYNYFRDYDPATGRRILAPK